MDEGWSWLRRTRRPNPYVVDGLSALVVGVSCLLSLYLVPRTANSSRDADALGVALIVIGAGALVWRRRWPVVALLQGAGATVTVFVLGYPDSGLPFVVLIALYTVASRCDRRVAVAATGALLLAIGLVIADAGDMDGGTLAGTLAVFTMAAVWGDRRKVRDAYSEQLELRAAEKERERIEAVHRAAGEERLRIAREMHDVVAHAMGVVAVQSGVGAHVIDSRPDEAKRILETISRTSRDSLDEMRRVLGVLRDERPSAAAGAAAGAACAADELAPAPGLGGLDRLVARVAEAGVTVEAQVEGERTAIPIGVDLAAYRIVQEALTNVVKHAGPARVSVLVRYEPGAVRVEVADDGRGTVIGGDASSPHGAGHGLVGMRERAARYGAVLEAGPRPAGGYRVAVTLPFGAS